MFTLVGLASASAEVAGASTRYDDSDPRIAWSGNWFHDGGGSGFFNDTLSSYRMPLGHGHGEATVAFNGTGISWIAVKDSYSGIASVTIDGGPSVAVDLYSPVELDQQAVYSVTGLAPGPHLLNIASTDRFNPAAPGADGVTVDAFDIEGTLTDIIPTRYEDSDARISYVGSWADASGGSGGSVKQASSAGAASTITFVGTSVNLVALAGPDAGIARVVLDAQSPATVDLYAPTAHITPAWSLAGLPYGPHTLRVEWTGTKNAASAGTAVNVDAVDVVGVLSQAPASYRYDDSDPRIAWRGNWDHWGPIPRVQTKFFNDTLSGLGQHAEMTLAFNGTSISWIAVKDSYSGIASVTVDGGTATAVDLYSPLELDQQAVYSVSGLAPGPHLLNIATTGRCNPAAPGADGVIVDAFDVEGTLTDVTPTRYEQTDSRITYAGSWADVTGAGSGGSVKRADAAGAGATITFVGTSVNLVALAGPDAGIARVVLDTQSPSTADLYAATAHITPAWSIAGLPYGPHTLRVEWTGTKNAASSGTAVNVDAVDVVGVLSQAPASYRYDDTDPRIAWRGNWNHYTAQPGIGSPFFNDTLCSFGAPPDQHAEMTVAFNGTSISWIANKDQYSSIASVTVDGGTSTAVDLYAPTQLSQQSVYTVSGLAPGPHLLNIATTRRGNPAGFGGIGVTVDAFDIAGVLTDVTPTRYEGTDSRITYAGSWADVSGAGSGGSVRRADAAGSASTITFVGTSVNLVALAGPDAGIARVVLDTQNPATVDLYAPMAHITPAWSMVGLPYGPHTLRVEWTGTKNAASAGTAVNVDAVDVVGVLSQAPASYRYDDTDPRIAWRGNWDHYNWQPDWVDCPLFNTTLSSFCAPPDQHGEATVAFTGTGISWIANKDQYSSIASVTVDGGTSTAVDLYAPTSLHQQAVYTVSGLTPGPHLLNIATTGRTNPAALGGPGALTVDAFDVTGVLTEIPPTPARFEQSDSRIVYEGAWDDATNASRSGGSWRYTQTPGAAADIAFTGTTVRWIASVTPGYGKARVTIDGGTAEVVDLYSPFWAHQQCVWSRSGLAPGPHTLRIEYTGDKNAASTGTVIGIDALDVLGTLTQAVSPVVRFEQSDSRIVYEGAWDDATNASRSGGSWRYTQTPGAAADIAFTGTTVRWIASVTPGYGKARVTIDGGTAEVVDLYSPFWAHQQCVWSRSGLAPGPHTLRIEYTGDKNAASTGTVIGIDALDVLGTLQ